MRHGKCYAYIAKETLGYQGGKPYVSAARRAAEREEIQRRIKREVKTQTKNQSFPKKKRETHGREEQSK